MQDDTLYIRCFVLKYCRQIVKQRVVSSNLNCVYVLYAWLSPVQQRRFVQQAAVVVYIALTTRSRYTDRIDHSPVMISVNLSP